MDKSLEVFWDSIHSFYIFGIQKCKNRRFLWKQYFWVHFYPIELNVFRTGPGDLNTKHLKFDMRQFFYAFLKEMEKKSHFPRILNIVSSTR